MKCAFRLVILLLILLFLNALSQDTIQTVFVNTAPQIDGLVNESVWQQAGNVERFIQLEPNIGEAMTEKTKVFICHDNDNLYVGFRCYDDPALVTGKEMARDVSLGQDDHVEILLDTFLDHRNGYFFSCSPRGSYGDAIISKNGAARNKQWDGLWEARAQIHDEGWDAEFIIPFKTLSFRPEQSTWAVKFIRLIARKSERAYWPVANLNNYQFQISDAGLLQGLEGLSQGIGLDIRPYGLAGIDQKKGQKTDFIGDAGLDVFYQLSSGMKSMVTVNTDFAQTEVDSRQINLTRFKTHFPEKRDFFLEGADHFNFGIDGESTPYSKRVIPFFSRQIGLDQDGNPIPINWGAKITGKVMDWELGLLSVEDDRKDGAHHFTVARANRNLGGQSSLGVIGTLGNAGPEDNHVLGVDMKLGTSTFGGDKNLSMLLFGLQSKTDGVSGKDRSFGGEIVYPNDQLDILAGFHQIEENFIAGIGYVPRKDIRESYLHVNAGKRPRKYGLLKVTTGASIDYLTDMQNTLLTREITVTPVQLNFLSGESVELGYSSQYERLRRDFNIYHDNIIPMDVYSFDRYTFAVSSAKRRNFWISGKVETGTFYNGNRRDLTSALGWQAAIPLFLSLEVEQNYIELPESDFTTEVYRFSGNVLFSPRLVLYNYIQYDSDSRKMGWQSRFRWIWRPGNEVLLVYNSILLDPLEYREVTESSTRFKINYNYRF